MHGAALNPALIQALLIIVFLVITQIMRAAKRSKGAQTGAQTGVGTGSPLTDALREAMRQRAEQARARQGAPPVQEGPGETELLQLDEEFQQPPTIQPESSIVPSLLLLALFACLCLMAYRYWAG